MTSTTVRGTCHHDCPDSCGWEVTVEDGTAVRLRGNPAHPFSRGELCPKVNRFLDRVHSPARVLHPLRNAGAKGEGRFERISWDDALAEIADRWRTIISEHGAEALLPYVSAGNQGLLALFFGERFWNRVGASRLQGALCGSAAGAGAATTNGDGRGVDPVEVVHSRLVILWGTNTRLTNRHLWPFVEEARANGARIVVVDPIRTLTAESADWFLQPLPGTDVALMLGMMHVLVRDDLVDHEWIAAHTDGFDELAAHVQHWTPQRSAETCGLTVDDVEQLAHMYGSIRPSLIRTLIGAEHHEHGAMFFRALTCLPALVGAWRDRGGGFARSVGTWSNAVTDLAALTRPDLLGGRATRSLWMPQLGRILTETEPPVYGLFLQSVNAMVSVPNTDLLRRGLLRDDLFTVVHEQFLTDTARYADIVLPATTHIEAIDVVPSWGHLYLGWNEAAIEPLGEAVSNAEVHRRFARAMGYTESVLYDDDVTALRSALPSIDLDRLRSEHFVRVPHPHDGRPFADGGFATATGRVQLSSPGLPDHRPAEEFADGRHPFVLLSPKQHVRFLNSSYSHLPAHADPEGGPRLEMSVADAQRLHLGEGALARVWNDRGELRLPVRIVERLRPGVVSIPWGWWRDAHPDGRVVNTLTNDRLTDWGGGVAYLDTAVSIAPVTP